MKYMLNNEINLIKNKEIRKLVKNILKLAPRYFWVVPSSSTGKHHPPDEDMAGGKVLHTKRVVYLANQLCRLEDINGIERYKLLAAMIVHDIFCQGTEDKLREKTDPNHPLYVRMKTGSLSSSPYYEDIIQIVEGHMGRWGPSCKGSLTNRLIKLGHIADYIASRREVMIILPESNIKVRQKLEISQHS